MVLWLERLLFQEKKDRPIHRTRDAFASVIRVSEYTFLIRTYEDEDPLGAENVLAIRILRNASVTDMCQKYSSQNRKRLDDSWTRTLENCGVDKKYIFILHRVQQLPLRIFLH